MTTRPTPNLALAICLVSGLAAVASGQTLRWIDPSGGFASDPTNWSPSQAPGPTSNLVFDIFSTGYGVTYDALVPVVASHTFRDGIIHYVLNHDHTITGALTIAPNTGDTTMLTLAAGNLEAGSIALGLAPGSEGTLVCDNTGSILLSDTTIVLGVDGDGFLFLANGASIISAGSVTLGSGAGYGQAMVFGSFTDDTAETLLAATGASADIIIARGGSAFLNLAFGAHASAADDLILAMLPGSDASMTVGDNAGGPDTILLIGDDLYIANDPFGNAAGEASLTLRSSASVSLADDLFLGENPGDVALLSIQAATLHAPGDAAIHGRVTLSDNAVLSASRITLDGTIEGHGRVEGELLNLGEIVPIDLTLAQGVVTSSQRLIQGSLLTLGSQGTFRASGQVDASFASVLASSLELTADLTIGRNTGECSIDIQGATATDRHWLTLHATSPISLGHSTSLNTGLIRSIDQPLTLRGDLTGRGALDTNAAIILGMVAPGVDGTSSGVSLIDIFGDATLTGGMLAEISRFAQNDALLVSGVAHLDGHLEVTVDPLYQPALGAEHFLVTAQSVTGRFDTLELPPKFIARYAPQTASVRYCPSDFFTDGTVNTIDVLAFLTAWAQRGPGADFNEDGLINTLDVLDFLNNWTSCRD